MIWQYNQPLQNDAYRLYRLLQTCLFPDKTTSVRELTMTEGWISIIKFKVFKLFKVLNMLIVQTCEKF